jgi:hypothetical protein
MNSMNNFSTIRSMKVHEEKINFRAKEMFKSLANFLNHGKNFIKSVDFSDFILLFRGDYLNEFSKELIDEFLTHMAEDKDSENFEITEKDFCDFVTGQSIKKLIFEQSIDDRINQIGKITKLYNSLGGNEIGISSQNLKKSLDEFMEYIIDPDGYLEGDDKIEREYCKKETEKFIKIIASSDDSLTLEDFINAITNKTNTKFDNFALETS